MNKHENIKLKNFFDLLPKDITKIDKKKAYLTLLRVFLTNIILLIVLIHLPSNLIIFGWILSGTAFFGFFSILHDCAHYIFDDNKTINEIVGTLCGIPILFPFHAWKFVHEYHHKYTNHLYYRDIWTPTRIDVYSKSFLLHKVLSFNKKEYDKYNLIKKLITKIYQYFLGGGFGFLIYQWILVIYSFKIKFFLPVRLIYKYDENSYRIIISYFFFLLGVFLQLYILNFYGNLFKIYFIPLLIFVFWMTIFTYFHHRHPGNFFTYIDIKWREDLHFNNISRLLESTAHIDYPYWIEWLVLYF
jgi:omega-6 fatty acid desaturase (delta-12 desaturase)